MPKLNPLRHGIELIPTTRHSRRKANAAHHRQNSLAKESLPSASEAELSTRASLTYD